MNRMILRGIFTFVLAAHSQAQTSLYGFRANGALVKIDPVTGAGTFIGNPGIVSGGAQGPPACGDIYQDCSDYILTVRTAGPQAGQLFQVNRYSGTIWQTLNTAAIPSGYSVHGMSGNFAILHTEDPTASNLLASYGSGAWNEIGPTGRADLESLACSPTGMLYALGTGSGGALFSINTTNGAATLIAGGSFDGDRGLAFMPDGTLLSCGTNLRSVNPLTGTTTLIGPIGFPDIQVLAAVTRERCYINCDHNQAPPPLNANDFNCFLSRFAQGDPWANCDQSTSSPILNVNDFMCYMNTWAAGCT